MDYIGKVSKTKSAKSKPLAVKMKMNPKVAKALSLKKKIEKKILAIGGKALLRKVQKAAAKRLVALTSKSNSSPARAQLNINWTIAVQQLNSNWWRTMHK